MQVLLQILGGLGVNKTVFLQIIPFFVAYFFLANFLFRPYIRNLQYRRKFLGIGNKGGVSEMQEEVEKMQREYQEKLRVEMERAQNLFHHERAEAMAEAEKMVADAKLKSAKIVDETKKQVHSQVKSVQDQMAEEIPQMSALIAGKVLGRAVK